MFRKKKKPALVVDVAETMKTQKVQILIKVKGAFLLKVRSWIVVSLTKALYSKLLPFGVVDVTIEQMTLNKGEEGK